MENRGGKRSNSGAKQKYAEKTVMVCFRCPESKADELRKYVNSQLDKWKVVKNDFQISDIDKHLLESRKYVIKKIWNQKHIFRVANGSKRKFNVLLAQDIIGINCEILFIDGNALNNERENIKPVNRDVEYLY